MMLYENYLVAREASKLDDKVDANKDGVADVMQISGKDLVKRKLHVLAVNIDPVVVSNAVTGISAGVFAVIATVRVRFAQAVTLGSALGEMAGSAALNFLQAPLTKALDPEYHRLIVPGVNMLARSMGVMLAWTLQRVLSTFHSALRGSSMIVTASLSLYSKKNKGKELLSAGDPNVTFATGALTLMGFWWQVLPLLSFSLFPFFCFLCSKCPVVDYPLRCRVVFVATLVSTHTSISPRYCWQVSSGFSLPFPLNVLFLPVVILEWFCAMLINMVL